MIKQRAKAEDWERLQEMNKESLRQFYINVEYLCRQRKISKSEAVRRIRRLGYSAEVKTIKCYIDGKFTDSKLSNLQKWCLLFGESLGRMMYFDYAGMEIVESYKSL